MHDGLSTAVDVRSPPARWLRCEGALRLSLEAAQGPAGTGGVGRVPAFVCGGFEARCARTSTSVVRVVRL